MTLAELQAKRLEIVNRMQAINDLALAESRALSAEESTNWSKAFDDQEALRKQIDDIGLATTRKAQLAGLQTDLAKVSDRAMRPDPDAVKKAKKSLAVHQTEEYRASFAQYLMGDLNQRDLQADLPTKGGYLVAPEQLVMQIIKEIDDMVKIRNLATKFQVPTAASLGVPKRVTRADAAEWTSELATGSLTGGPTFGKRELYPHPLAKEALCSAKLLRVAILDIEAFLQAELAYQFAIAEENAFLTGNGVNKPLGMFVNSVDGITAARDVLSGATTDYTFDGLVSAKYKLKDQYRVNAQWLFHRSGIEKIAKLKDLEGRYLWEASRQLNTPDVLLGHPVISSEFVPNTFTASLYVGMFADFRNYWIADALDMSIIRLNELGALTNQVYYVARKETDGAPILEEAFARIVTNP